MNKLDIFEGIINYDRLRFEQQVSNDHSKEYTLNEASRYVSMLRGHADVVQDVMEKWPSLCEKVDENGQNLLHYACKFGEPEIARLILRLCPDMAQSYDKDGYTPLHLAAVHNNGEIFKDFEAQSFLALTKQHDTIVHLIIRHNHYDAFLSLVQILNDNSSQDLLQRCDQQGNTPLYLALSGKCLEIAKHLINKSTKEQPLETKNDAGFTSLDILNGEDLNESHQRESLFQMNKRLSPSTGEPIQQHEVKDEHAADEIQFKKSSSTSSSQGAVSQDHKAKASYEEPLYEAVKGILDFLKVEKDRRKDRKGERMQEMHMEGLQNARNTINIIAILIATVTFTGCLSPPGGFFQGGPNTGKPVLGQTTAFKVFSISNDVALFLSLGIVVILVSIIPFRITPMRKVLSLTHKLLWLAVSFMATAYIAARWATTLQVRLEEWTLGIVLSICGGFLVMVFVVFGIMQINSKLNKFVWRQHPNLARGSFSVDSDMESRYLSGFLTL